MKPIDVKEHVLNLQPLQFVNYRTPRVTQILSGNAAAGGITSRNRSYLSIQTLKPYIVISISAYDAATGLLNNDILRSIVVRSSIMTYDTYSADSGDTSYAVQVDPFNVYSYLYMTKGRLSFDMEEYATGLVSLDILSALRVRTQLKIRVEVFSKDDTYSLPTGARRPQPQSEKATTTIKKLRKSISDKRSASVTSTSQFTDKKTKSSSNPR